MSGILFFNFASCESLIKHGNTILFYDCTSPILDLWDLFLTRINISFKYNFHNSLFPSEFYQNDASVQKFLNVIARSNWKFIIPLYFSGIKKM